MAGRRRICVFCGRCSGTGQRYIDLARHMGTLLARAGLGLVYGGSVDGLMGEMADAALAQGGEVVGVIPKGLRNGESTHPGLTQLHVVDSMHARKAMMAQLADAFIAIPGGFGTLDEFFEIATWQQLGLHDKPVGLLNAYQYYEKLLGFLQHCRSEGFVTGAQSNGLSVAETPEILLSRMGITALEESARPLVSGAAVP